MIYNMMSTPIKGLLDTNNKFAKFHSLGSQVNQYKLIHIGINLILLAMGLYKLNSMGLLPLSPSDYVDLVPKSRVRNIGFIDLEQ